MVTTYMPGMTIGNPQLVEGALGCFARLTDGSIVLLSNAHVLFGGATTGSPGGDIFQPPASSSCCQGSGIATRLGSWTGGFRGPISVTSNDFSTPPKPELHTGYDTDCAIARLKGAIKYTNAIPIIGMLAAPPASGNGVMARDVFGSESGIPVAADLIRFYSPVDTTVKFGIVVKQSFSAMAGGVAVPIDLYPKGSVVAGDGDVRPLINQFFVLPVDPPGSAVSAPDTLQWCKPGDSGSIVVNAANQVIGMVTSAKSFSAAPTDPAWLQAISTGNDQMTAGAGLVTPIANVIAQIATMGFTITIGPIASSTPAEGPRMLTESEREHHALIAGRAHVAAILRQSRIGQIVLGKLRQHADEARTLVARDRRAQAAWHRVHGPAFVQHYIKNLRDASHRVPDSINGVSRAQALAVMLDALAHGGPALQRDVARYRAILLRHAPRLDTLDRVGAVIEDAHHEMRQP